MSVAEPDDPVTMDDLRDPNSKINCFVLFMLSLEPPFYHELNQACVLPPDNTKAQKLGGIALILSEILKNGQLEANRESRLPLGRDDVFNVDDLGYYTQSFLVFKGCAMKSSWIKGWKSSVGLSTG